MNSFPRMLLFASIMTVTLTVGHYYLWRRFARDTELAPSHRRAVGVALTLLAVALPLVMVSSRGFPQETIKAPALVAFVWLGMLSTLVWTLLSGDALRFVLRTLKKRGENETLDPQRRQTLNRLFAGGVALGGTALGGVAVAQALRGFTLKEVEVSLEKLPRAFDGFRIVQMSDIHVGPTIGGDFVRAMVSAANSLKPDLMAITGDLVDGSVQHLQKHTAPLADLKSVHGSFFVTGNHEYYSGADDWVEELSRLGVNVLRNQATRISRGEDSFLLVGVTDHRAGDFGDAPDLARALRERAPADEVVLLAHQPREIAQATALDVGLQLSGHTHGGQFWPWSWLIYLVEPVVAGLARFGRTQIYVNSGTGYWGPPMRMGTESELTLITLRSAQA